MDAAEGPPKTHDEARRFAEQVVRWGASVGMQLDFSPASLEQLDLLFGTFRSTRLTVQSSDAAAFWAAAAGYYLGEVIIRRLGGRWVPVAQTEYAQLPGAGQFPLVVELPGGIICHPLARPYKLMETGEGDSLAGFLAGIESAARSSPSQAPPPPRRPWWRFWGK